MALRHVASRQLKIWKSVRGSQSLEEAQSSISQDNRQDGGRVGTFFFGNSSFLVFSCIFQIYQGLKHF